MRAALFAAALFLIALHPATAQSCPKENPSGPSIDSSPQTISGRVVYHNGIRQWFGLQLDAPVCGEKEIQLLQGGGAFEVDEGNAHAIETFRGCRVTVHGPLGIPGTGYYSAALYQNANRIEPANCVLKPHFPDYSKAKPSPAIRKYSVAVRIDYLGDHITITPRSANRLLTPWQAYANYMFTGGFVLYAYCADGFDLTHFDGTPEAKPWLIDNYLAMDPETAATKHVTHLYLNYTCRRDPKDAESSPR